MTGVDTKTAVGAAGAATSWAHLWFLVVIAGAVLTDADPRADLARADQAAAAEAIRRGS